MADSTFFGTITPPAAIADYGASGGLITLTTNLLRMAIIVGGLIALYNIVMAGYTYLTSAGDAKAHEKVMSKLNMSLWGLVIMILAPALMALTGFLLFKDATFFVSPVIQGPGAPASSGGGPEGGPGRNSGSSSNGDIDAILKALPDSLRDRNNNGGRTR
ncbi:MAG: hypothetical protein HZA34_03065 [Candidatus Pacebacteria bacterium]|nr:hypothetical protein [Candidatus Paceibacterota bacterium]